MSGNKDDSKEVEISSKKIILDDLKLFIKILNGENINEDADDRLKEAFQNKSSNNFKAILLTDIGQITADIEDIEAIDNVFEIKEDNNLVPNISVLSRIRDNKIDEIKEKQDVEIIDNGKIINLKNAELRPPSNPDATFNYPILILFVDQIIGFTLHNQVQKN